VDFAALAARTAGYSGDDITGVCRDAAMNSLRRQIRGKSQAELVAMRDSVAHEPVNMDDFLQACPFSSAFRAAVPKCFILSWTSCQRNSEYCVHGCTCAEPATGGTDTRTQ